MPNEAKTKARRPRRMARQLNVNESNATAGATNQKADEASAAQQKQRTKSDLLLNLLRREEGATLDQMVEATGWLPHTSRAALTGLKKKDHVLTSEKVDGVRTYRIVWAAKA